MIQDLTEGDPQKTLIVYTLPMFISVVFQQFYNMADSMIAGRFAGEDALAAVGASYPITMISMAVAVGSNIGLDLLFVAVFSWGVAGVAWATFIAQGIACVLALLSFRKRLRELKSTERAPLFSFSLLKKISLIAVPSILQQSFVSVGNIFIQGLVNSYGSGVIAGYSAAIRLNTFVITGFSTLGNGVSGFTAQNLGAGHCRRVLFF